MRKVAVIGSSGQLGSDLVKAFKSNGWNTLDVTHGDVCVEDDEGLQRFFKENPVDLIINTAALHQVAVCEKEVSRSWQINSQGALNVAQIGNSLGARVVFISTDYVFDGSKGHSYDEVDSVSPINVYGASKAAGEFATLATSQDHLVVRVSSVFGAAGSSGKGGNFIETIVSKAKGGENLKVVDDIYMSPSYTVDIAAKLVSLIDLNVSGIFHLNNDGVVSWHDFATEICTQLGLSVKVERTATDNTQTPKRPSNSSLGTQKLVNLGIRQHDWKDALNRYLLEKGHLV